jgi:hypothetical protein
MDIEVPRRKGMEFLSQTARLAVRRGLPWRGGGMDCSGSRPRPRVALRALLEAGSHLPHLLKRVDGVQDLPLLGPAEGSLRVPHPSCD